MLRSRRLASRCLTALLLLSAGEGSGAVFSPGPGISMSSIDAPRIPMGSACWVVPGTDVLNPVKARSPRRKISAAKSHRKVHSPRKVRRVLKPPRPRRAAVHRPAPVPKVECVLFEPQTAVIEPFAETMARLMEPAAVNEREIQKLIQKRQRRPRRRRAEPVAISVAPELASWLMMITGFAAIGIAMRRRRPVIVRTDTADARCA